MYEKGGPREDKTRGGRKKQRGGHGYTERGNGDFRVVDHPVLGELPAVREVTIYLDGQPLSAREGEPLAAALFASGIRVAHYLPEGEEPRGPFCMIGRCTECRMWVEGRGMVLSCLTPVEKGMRVHTPGRR